jgi:hypothetical protein
MLGITVSYGLGSARSAFSVDKWLRLRKVTVGLCPRQQFILPSVFVNARYNSAFTGFDLLGSGFEVYIASLGQKVRDHYVLWAFILAFMASDAVVGPF